MSRDWLESDSPEQEPEYFHMLAEESVDTHQKLVEVEMLVTSIGGICQEVLENTDEEAEENKLAYDIQSYVSSIAKVLNA